MKSPKHTPGPWNAIEPNPEDRCHIETRKGGKLVAFIEGDDGSNHTDAANAARIVACVNSLEGIADPAAFMAIVRDNASLHMGHDGSACTCELCQALKGIV